MGLFSRILSPNQVMKYSGPCLKSCITIFIFLVTINIYMYLTSDLFDYKQGFYVQIMFIHVPAAWLAVVSYIMLGATSLTFIVTRHPIFACLSDVLCLCSLLYVVITLVTGSLWGKPIWGAWWVWDARLTSVLALFFILLSIYLLKRTFNDKLKGSLTSSFLTLIGLINIPIIKFSVEWWHTLHQPSSITLFGSNIHYSIFFLLISFFFSFLVFLLIILLLYIRTIILESKFNSL
nr:c1 cytochrome ABC transporter subunit [Cavernulicola chilensis]